MGENKYPVNRIFRMTVTANIEHLLGQMSCVKGVPTLTLEKQYTHRASQNRLLNCLIVPLS